jgi:peroxiredoxin
MLLLAFRNDPMQLRNRSLYFLLVLVTLVSCDRTTTKGRFTVSGTIKNAPDEQVYLDELHFNNAQATTLDTTTLKNGSFTLHGVAKEEGIYRIRMQGNNPGYIFINDQPEIHLTADNNRREIESVNFSSPANRSLQKFLIDINSLLTQHDNEVKQTDSLNALRQDSLARQHVLKRKEVDENAKNYILHFADTTSSPVLGIFSIGFLQGVSPDDILKAVNDLGKRFPQHTALQQQVKAYNDLVNRNKPKPADSTIVSDMAPELSMPDTSGKMFTLSSLRGKYVLVDFWASWCGPCREENPNVVAAYQRFRDKNFTVLGVSLDKEKGPWLKAIHNDGLTWNHISDLKYWSSAAVDLYKFDGIPYNVLIDPQGKIIARALRGEDLQNKLAEVLK